MLVTEPLEAHDRGTRPQHRPEPDRKAPGKAALLVSCPAASGLVTQLLGFIHSHGGAISQVDHHLDHDTGLSFTRIEWDLARFDLAPEETGSAGKTTACWIGLRRAEIWSESFWPGLSDSTWRIASPYAEAGRWSLGRGTA